eukprot:NODE_1941_length_527_cov_234.985356_g1579_i0.p2 GENE.NODE_1941_length_527_cov_234.985356_g1579_i0~~NODE_1941_length_527_cov_234.985356_g1579_i0.p2  ORF type:complete len:93 (+),score=41.23 NODE_1941_length_527_cov_234.985356_g1579_i0:31-309(+)
MGTPEKEAGITTAAITKRVKEAEDIIKPILNKPKPLPPKEEKKEEKKPEDAAAAADATQPPAADAAAAPSAEDAAAPPNQDAAAFAAKMELD